MICKFVHNDAWNWNKCLEPLLFSVREVPQASTGFSPFNLLCGCRPCVVLDDLKENWEEGPLESINEFQYVLVIFFLSDESTGCPYFAAQSGHLMCIIPHNCTFISRLQELAKSVPNHKNWFMFLDPTTKQNLCNFTSLQLFIHTNLARCKSGFCCCMDKLWKICGSWGLGWFSWAWRFHVWKSLCLAKYPTVEKYEWLLAE